MDINRIQREFSEAQKTFSLVELRPTADGKVFAKTGTLGEARALSGYIITASGQTVAFSIMCTDHNPTPSSDRAAMDKIVAAIAESN